MDTYEQIKDIEDQGFKQITGIEKSTFSEMLQVLATAEAKKKAQGGKPNKLSLADRLLMSLKYLKGQGTYLHLGKHYGISESACYRNCRWIQTCLEKSQHFQLPQKEPALAAEEWS